MKRGALLLLSILWVFSGYAQTGCPYIDAGPDQNHPCFNPCDTLWADYFEVGQTTTYTVGSIPYNPPYSFTGGTAVFISSDDEWSSVINLPFNFCFYGNNYSQILVGANGVLTFDVSLANNYCEWSFGAPIPTPGPPPGGIYNNSINGAYHDIDPSVAFSNADINYSVRGTAPCRSFVVNYTDVDHYNCTSFFGSGGLQTTQQIILYETTNVVEVYINEKPVCNSWNGGNAVIGLQNANGTQGITPPGRNTGPWSANNEAWQFVPAGPSSVRIDWFYNNLSTHICTGDSMPICYPAGGTFIAQATYYLCNGDSLVIQDNMTINTGTPYTIDSTVMDESCLGLCDGSINLTPTGGIPPFTWDIGNGPQATGNFTNLCSGTYVISVSDNSNCNTTVTIDIGTDSVTTSASSVDETCLNANDGSITITASGGTGPYTYDIGVGPTNGTGVFNGLAPGNYNYTVTDANGCTDNGSATVNAGPVCCSFTASGTSTDETCAGACDGTATISLTGGTGPFSYDIGSGPQANDNFTALCAGNYVVSVTDAQQCSSTVNINIQSPAAITTTDSTVEESCIGAADGEMYIIAVGGNGPYNYDFGFTSNTTGAVIGLAPGTYTYTITDANGCTYVDSAVVDPALLCCAFSASASFTNETCASACDGTADISLIGGAAPFSYDIGNGAQGQNTFASLCPGSYTATVSDANGCVATTDFDILPGALVTATGSTTDETCAGANDGTMTLSASGGTAPYTYTIDAANSNTTGQFTGLADTTYYIDIVDANGCTFLDTLTVAAGPNCCVMTNTVSYSDLFCYEDCSGTITLTENLGNAPVQFSIDGGATFQTTGSFTGLCAGVYDILIVDAFGCTYTDQVTLGQPAALGIQLINTEDATCFGFSDGSIDISTSGGTGMVSPQWNIGQSTEDISGIEAGAYSVTITDDNGCELADTFTIAQPLELEAQGDITDISCFGQNDGAIDLSVTGGTGTYSFAWSNTDVTEDVQALPAGPVDVVVTDQNGCTTTESFSLNEPQELLMTHTEVAAKCSEDNGACDIVVSGGTLPYDVYWPDGEINQNRTGLAPGNYMVTLEDRNGCTITEEIVIGDSPVLTIDAGIYDTLLIGNSMYLIPQVSDSGAVNTISWSPGIDLDCNDCWSPQAMPLETVTYLLSIEDTFGCRYSDETEIIVFSDPDVFVPNAFTPNGDGLNDMFNVLGREILGGELHIFDRWGEQLYVTDDISRGWDGFYKGELCQPGTYVFWLRVDHYSGRSNFLEGSVLLLW